MNITCNTLVAALLLAGSTSAFAASSVDLTVRGTITPSACEPTLSGGGVVDLGKISAKDLNVDGPTYLPRHSLQLALTCDAPTPVAMQASDNRAGSAYNSTVHYGLGLINTDEKLGAMELRLGSTVADGVTVNIIGSTDKGTTWSGTRYFMRDNIIAPSVGSTNIPVAVQLFTADLQIDAEIAPTNQLTLTNEVAIDGSVTLSVVYL